MISLLNLATLLPPFLAPVPTPTMGRTAVTPVMARLPARLPPNQHTRMLRSRNRRVQASSHQSPHPQAATPGILLHLPTSPRTPA